MQADGSQQRIGHYCLFAALITIAAFLRVGGLSDWMLSRSEVDFLQTALRPNLSGLISDVYSRMTIPPTLLLLLRGFAGASDNVLIMRAPAWLSGIALVWVWYLIGRTLSPRQAPSTAMALMALSMGALITQSQLVPARSLSLMCVSLAFLFLLRYLRHPIIKNLALYGLFALLGSMLEYGAVVLPACFALASCAWLVCNRHLKDASWLAVTTLFCLMPSLVFLFFHLQQCEDMNAFLPVKKCFRFTDSYQAGFLYSWAGLPGALSKFMHYLYRNDIGSIVLCGLCILGIINLIMARSWLVLSFILLPLLAFTLLARAAIYPLYDGPESLMLSLVAALAATSAFLPLAAAPRATGLANAVLAVPAIIALLASTPLSPDYYRIGERGFDVRFSDYAALVDSISSGGGKQDALVITEPAAIWYNRRFFHHPALSTRETASGHTPMGVILSCPPYEGMVPCIVQQLEEVGVKLPRYVWVLRSRNFAPLPPRIRRASETLGHSPSLEAVRLDTDKI